MSAIIKILHVNNLKLKKKKKYIDIDACHVHINLLVPVTNKKP